MIRKISNLIKALEGIGYSKNSQLLLSLAQLELPNAEAIVNRMGISDPLKKEKVLKFLKIKNLTYGNKEGREGEVSTALKSAENFINSNQDIAGELKEAATLWEKWGNWSPEQHEEMPYNKNVKNESPDLYKGFCKWIDDGARKILELNGRKIDPKKKLQNPTKSLAAQVGQFDYIFPFAWSKQLENLYLNYYTNHLFDPENPDFMTPDLSFLSQENFIAKCNKLGITRLQNPSVDSAFYENFVNTMKDIYHLPKEDIGETIGLMMMEDRIIQQQGGESNFFGVEGLEDPEDPAVREREEEWNAIRAQEATMHEKKLKALLRNINEGAAQISSSTTAQGNQIAPILNDSARTMAEEYPESFLQEYSKEGWAKPFLALASENAAKTSPYEFLKEHSKEWWAQPFLSLASENFVSGNNFSQNRAIELLKNELNSKNLSQHLFVIAKHLFVQRFDLISIFKDAAWIKDCLDFVAKTMAEEKPSYVLSYSNIEWMKPYRELAAKNLINTDPLRFISRYRDTYHYKEIEDWAQKYFDLAAQKMAKENPKLFLEKFNQHDWARERRMDLTDASSYVDLAIKSSRRY